MTSDAQRIPWWRTLGESGDPHGVLELRHRVRELTLQAVVRDRALADTNKALGEALAKLGHAQLRIRHLMTVERALAEADRLTQEWHALSWWRRVWRALRGQR